MTMNIVWGVGVAWIVFVLIVIRAAIGETRFVKAQHRAYRDWNRTGQIVPGWSHHWKWSHPKDIEVPAGVTTIINNFFTTIVQVVNVTHVHVKALIIPGLMSRGGGSSGRTETGGSARVIPGQTLPSALPDGSSRTGSVVGSVLGAVRGRDAA